MTRWSLVIACAGALAAQTDVLTVAPPAKLAAKRGEIAVAKIRVQLKPGYHTNSNKPSEDYLIPLRLTWDAKPLEVASIDFPAAHMEKYEFAEKPLSVFTGDFDITTSFRVPATAATGLALGVGKLRYQACSLKACLTPKTVEVKLPIEVR